LFWGKILVGDRVSRAASSIPCWITALEDIDPFGGEAMTCGVVIETGFCEECLRSHGFRCGRVEENRNLPTVGVKE